MKKIMILLAFFIAFLCTKAQSVVPQVNENVELILFQKVCLK